MKLTHNQFRLIIIAWIIAAIVSAVYLSVAKNPFKIGTLSDPTSESAVAQKIMENKLPYGASSIIILYKNDSLSANDPNFKSEVTKSLDGLKKLTLEHHITSPYQNSKQISDDKHAAYAVLQLNQPAEQVANHMKEIRDALGKPKNLEIYVGGQPSFIADVNVLSESNLLRAEMIALPICFIVMIFIFGGVLAALLPIIAAIISITIIITLLYLLGNIFELTIFVLNIATMLGLGLCLDYTLLITQRYREEMAKIQDYKKAIQKTMMTAGESVFFSGLTVLISISSLLFFKGSSLYSIGMGGVVVVAVTVFCSLTLMPAMLCLLEKNVDAFSFSILKPICTENIHHHEWYRFAMLVMRHPFLFFIPTVVFLLMLGMPFLNVKLNSSNARILPAWVESRQLWDQYSNSFDENELTPIHIVFTAKNGSILTSSNIGSLYDFTRNLEKDSRVKQISGILNIKKDFNKHQYQKLYSSTKLPFDDNQKQFFHRTTKDKYTVMTVISKYSEEDHRSIDLVNKIRSSPIHNNITKQVAGTTAEVTDTIYSIYKLFFKVVIIISIIIYIVLVILLRSIFLPFKAIIMNFLSLSVCYGMLVYIFQEGHFSKFLGFQPLGYTELDLPILLFFALFGLSMDYEVFLLTRIKEFYQQTGDNKKSVALGLERSARIITSAALILVIVSGAFVTADIVFIKAFGLGTALAIAVDATFIRLLLVPATMRFMGDWNWYLPKWLDRIIPNVEFDKMITPNNK